MELAQKLLSSLFPSRCLLCKKTVQKCVEIQGVEICPACYQALPHNTNACSRCALPLADDANATLCGRCIKKRPVFDYSKSIFRYEDDIIHLIHQIKFAEKISYTKSIGKILLKTVVEEILPEQGRPDCIIPVPLHNKRLRQRGYNQSTEISRVVSKATGISIAHDAVIRKCSTQKQTGLTAKERRKNIKGAYRVNNVAAYKHVLIVDDVVTTGSTVNELAKVLKRSGVEYIGVLSIARAPIKH